MTNIRTSKPCICLQCQATFFPFRSSKGIFCSNGCKFLAKTIDLKLVCDGCGILFHPKKKGKKYCSNPCYQETKRSRPAIGRLMENIEKTDYCWLWKGGINQSGYGRIFYAGNYWLAHRLMYTTATGEDITDKAVRHYECDNPPCCNPDHLRSGTKAENSDDMVRHGRHAHGETSYAKLTEKDVVAIRADKRTHTEIAKDYGISRRGIGHIITRGTWKHLP